MSIAFPRPLRAGVVGLGWAGQQHMDAYAALPGVELVALAGQEPEALDRLGAQYSVTRLHHDWQALVRANELDIISVATPTFLHAPITVAALEAGCHVFCEKPLARTGDEAETMVKAAERAQRVLKVCFNFRKRSASATAKELISDGTLGPVHYVKASWLRRNGIPRGWFGTRELSGGGPLIDLGVHLLDLSLHLLGDPDVRTVSASTYDELASRGIGFSQRKRSGQDRAFEVEDLATAFLRLEGGTTLVLESSWAGHRADEHFAVEIYGALGGITLTLIGEAAPLVLTTAEGTSALTPKPVAGEGHQAAIASFLDDIREGQWKPHTGRDGLERARVLDACYASARAGREMSLNGTT